MRVRADSGRAYPEGGSRAPTPSEKGSRTLCSSTELRLSPDGKGDGKLVPAAKVTWDNATKTIEIENYNALPVDLLSVSKEK